jgi:hypothetical protein
MSDDHIDHQGPPDKTKGAVPSAPDERDAIIERLERAVADERNNAATLREANEALRFKVEVLEKGYAKQLEDARLRGWAAERELADQQSRLAALGTGGEDTVRLLSETRAELQRVAADRDELRKQLGLSAGKSKRTAPSIGIPHVEDGSLTINNLIAGASFIRGRHPDGSDNANLHEQVRPEQEAPPEEMIAPELVFTKGRDRDGDES